MGRRWRARVFAGLGIVVGLVALALAMLPTPLGEELLRQSVEARLGRLVTTRVSVRHLDVSRRGFTLENVRLYDGKGEEILRIDRLRALPELGALARGHVRLQEAQLDAVTVAVREREDGTTNLTGVLRDGAVPLLPVARLVVTRGAATLTRRDGSHATLTGLAVAGPANDLTLEADAITYASASGSAVLAHVVTRLHPAPSAVRLGPTRADLVVARKGVTSRATPVHAARIDLAIPRAIALTATDVELPGVALATLSLDVERDGHVTGASAKGELRAAEVAKLLHRDVLAADLPFDVRLTPREGGFAVTADVRGPQGAFVRAEGRASTSSWDGNVTAEKLDLARALVGAPDVRVSTFRARASGRGAAFEVDASADGVTAFGAPLDRVRLRAARERGALEVTALDVDARGESAHAEGTLTRSGGTLDVHIGGGHVLATLDVRRTSTGAGALDLDLDVRDVALRSLGLLASPGRVRGRAHVLAAPGGTDGDADLVVALPPGGALRVRAARKAGRLDAEATLLGKPSADIAALLPPALRASVPEGALVALRAHLDGAAGRTRLDVDLDAAEALGADPLHVHGRLESQGPPSRLVREALPWSVDLSPPRGAPGPAAAEPAPEAAAGAIGGRTGRE